MASRFLVACLLAASVQANRNTFSSRNETELRVAAEVADGVILGFVGTAVPDFKSCVDDLQPVYDNVFEAVQDFKQKSFDSMMAGIRALAKGAKALPAALVKCRAAEAEVMRLVAAINQFKSPWGFAFRLGKDLLVNGHSIYDEITNAVTSWDVQNFTGCGDQIGMALGKLVIGNLTEGTELAKIAYDAGRKYTNCHRDYPEGWGKFTHGYCQQFKDMDPDDYRNVCKFSPDQYPAGLCDKAGYPKCCCDLYFGGKCQGNEMWVSAADFKNAVGVEKECVHEC